MTYDLEFLAVKNIYSRHHTEDVIVHTYENIIYLPRAAGFKRMHGIVASGVVRYAHSPIMAAK
jgi:hypothetical protein